MSGPAGAVEEALPGGPPTPAFEVLGAEPVAHAVAPTLRLRLRVSDASGADVQGIVLGAQLNVDPARRTYDAATKAKLVELFGAPDRWPATTRSFLWAQLGTLVPPFRGRTECGLDVACTYDLEVAAARYFYSLPDGAIPLSLHFSGTMLYTDGAGRLQVSMVPWSCSARHELPVDTWKALMALYYPGGSWIRLEAATLARLAERKAGSALPSFDATVRELLDG